MKNWLFLLLLGLVSPAFADNDHNDGNGNDDCIHSDIGCGDDDDSEICPKGDKGDKGDPGQDGEDGTNGKDGQAGKDGQSCGYQNRTGVGVEAVVRVHDGRRTTVEVFDAYDMRARRNHFLGIRGTLKLGKSWEQRERERLEAMLLLMEADLRKLKRYAHHPYKGQHGVFEPGHDDTEPTATTHSTNRGTR
jgi:hypothetical protein